LAGRQADVFGITDRGRIAAGARADLTVFALDDLVWSQDVEFVDDGPDGGARLRRPAGGFRFTVIDGTVVQEEGHLTGANPGGILSARV
jgi:N-acyl-D-amino-acid deacylase